LRDGGRSNLRGGNLNNICMIFMQLVANGAMAPVLHLALIHKELYDVTFMREQ
jgi:hypothetical protein